MKAELTIKKASRVVTMSGCSKSSTFSCGIGYRSGII